MKEKQRRKGSVIFSQAIEGNIQMKEIEKKIIKQR